MNNFRIIGCIAMAMTISAISSTGAASQNTPRQPYRVPSVAEMLTAFEREYERPTNFRENKDGGWVFTVLSETDRYGLRDRVDPVLDGLEKLAMSSRSPNVRLHAVSWLAASGETGGLGTGLKRMDIPARLARVYQANQAASLIVRGVLQRMAFQANVPESVNFLRDVAQVDRPEDRGSDEPAPYFAIEELSKMGEPGRNALRVLHAQGLVRNQGAKAHLEELAKRDFRRAGR